MDEDIDAGSEIVRDLGMDPSMDIDSDQRAELLQKWHREDAEDAEGRDDDD